MPEALKIQPYDTTLRDGGQTADLNLSVGSKLRIASALDKMGFSYIEGGWPDSKPVDREFFAAARDLEFRNAQLVAFGMTGRVGVRPENDPGLNALLRSETSVITVFGKSWMDHVEIQLRTTGPKNIDSIHDTVQFLKAQDRRVFYDAEHFFDGYRHNPEYALETLLAAKEGGAEVVILCDTNGGSITEFITEATHAARIKLGEDFPLGIHVHNDSGLAVANTLAAVKAGATQVQGTVNGLGERTGNVDFCVLLPTASLKYNYGIGDIDLHEMKAFSGFVELETRIAVPANTPYVGRHAFTHKGGVHVDAVLKAPHLYEHVDPEDVGAERQFENSDDGGGANVMEMARKHGFELNKTNPATRVLVERMKDMQLMGDAQEFLLLHDVLTGEPRPIELLDGTRVTTTRGSNPDASVLVKVDGERVQRVAMGDGPIDAFDRTLRLVVAQFYLEINQMHLVDWVQPPTQKIGTDVEVQIRGLFGANGDRWTSIAKGTNQQQIGEDVLVDSYNYYILRRRRDPSFGGHFENPPQPRLKV